MMARKCTAKSSFTQKLACGLDNLIQPLSFAAVAGAEPVIGENFDFFGFDRPVSRKDTAIRDIAESYFENDTKAYRFAKVLAGVKKAGKKGFRTSIDCDQYKKQMPISTCKRYLDTGVKRGLLVHEPVKDNRDIRAYKFRDQGLGGVYGRVADTVQNFISSGADDVDVDDLFPQARKEKYAKKGGGR